MLLQLEKIALTSLFLRGASLLPLPREFGGGGCVPFSGGWASFSWEVPSLQTQNTGLLSSWDFGDLR